MAPLSILSFGVMFLVGTDTFLVAPLLPELTARFASPPASAGWMVSAYAIGYCVTAVFAGPVSDRFDRRRVLVAGMSAFSAATAACGLASTLWQMIALRALAGVCAAVAAPQVWAAIPQLVPPGRVVAAMAAPTAGLTVAQLVGVPVGSLLGAVSTAAPFLAVGAAGAGTSLALWLWYPPVPPQASKTRVIAQYGGLLAVPAARWRFAAYFVFQLGNFAVLSFAPTWFSTDFALDATGVGYAMIALGTGNTLGALAGPRIVARWGTGRTLLGCMLAYLVCYPALPWSGNLAVALAVLSVVFFTGGTLFPVFMGLLQSLTATARGTVSALANVLMYAGSAVAGALGGPLMTGSWGFAGIACLVWTTTACSTLLWARSGAMR
ncbi:MULTISPECIES: MFS transporter [Actinomycetaceae]|uniref:MFS transporter n=1 Tax=Actinomycetaceae TaxID=2049 RepID=UPI0003965029|nr:MFS transporter [Actinobaculum sp. oral taxon 183]ERH19418.1 transporter, major facilitator family protein [Actinobaculum sp. oral taxon 183 str. F0552]